MNFEAKESEKYQCTVNVRGEDYKIVGSMQTVLMLVNDPKKAEEYVQTHINTTQEQEVKENTHAEELYEQANSTINEPGPSTSKTVWKNKRNFTQEDKDATEFFLTLRMKYATEFDDKKTPKNNIWVKMAREMNDAGFFVGQGKDAAEKLRQKFANMQRTYFMHINHVKSTGKEKKDPPLFFDELNDIFKTKHKAHPVLLLDSEEEKPPQQNATKDVVSDEDSGSKEEGITNAIKNRFKRATKSCTPRSSTQTVLIEQFEKEREQRERHFKSLESLLQTQNQQWERMLDYLAQMCGKSKKQKVDEQTPHSDDEL